MLRAAHARAVLLALALCSPLRSARAEEPDVGWSPSFRLAYVAPADKCPDEPTFLGAIRARTDRVRLAEGGESAILIAVRIAAPRGRPVVGRIEIREPDGSRQERAVESATCDEVAKALALVVALYLDPDATAAEPVSPLPEPEPEPEPVPVPVPVPEPVPVRPRRRPPRSTPPAPPPRAPDVVFAAGLGAGFLGGLGPSAAPLGRGFAELTWSGLPRSGGLAARLRPSARIALDVATSAGDVAAGTQRYVLLAGLLRVCPLDVRLNADLTLGPCAAVQAGLHRGATEGVPNARDHDKPWLAPSGTLHGALDLTARVALELEGGALFPLVRTRFFLAPDATLWRAPVVAGTLSAAVSVRF